MPKYALAQRRAANAGRGWSSALVPSKSPPCATALDPETVLNVAAILVTCYPTEHFMQPKTLTPSQRRRLNTCLRQGSDVRLRQRAEAVLAACEGVPVGAVAQRCGVSRQSIYKWIEQATRSYVGKRAAARRGRPTVWDSAMLELVRAALDTSPVSHGLTGDVWNATLLQQYLERAIGKRLSRHTVRQGLRKAGFVWRRTRFVPAMQARWATKPR
jgi:transposase